jgi:carboxylesterase type B
MADPFIPHTFTHLKLGPLTGRLPSSTPKVIHFRSIPFARIPARFRQSILITSFSSDEPRDFTQFGTACPAPPQEDQTAAAGGLLPGEEERKFDEFSCLNLTISAPKEALGDKGMRAPVMVYVHGGAFKVGGGHVSALHGGDTTKLVDLSIREGNPVVIVSIQ